MRNNFRREYIELRDRELPKSVQFALLFLVLFIAFAATARAQNVTVLNTPTTTTLWAGTQDWSIYGLSSLTSPGSGVVLQGTAISTFFQTTTMMISMSDIPLLPCAMNCALTLTLFLRFVFVSFFGLS